MKSSKGFTLIEVVVILAILGVLAAVLTPKLMDYVESAKIRRAESDCKAIAAAITNFNRDVGNWPVFSGTPLSAAKATVELLYTDGDEPTVSVTGTGTGGMGNWLVSVNTNPSILQNHLEKNLTADGTSTYPTNKPFAWRGPYLTDFKADPWGNKYYVNVEFLQPDQAHSRKAVWVLSAGPNEVIETVYDQLTTLPPVLGNDDIGYRIK